MTMITLTNPAIRSRSLPRWSDLKTLFGKWLHRIQSRTELLALNDRELRDIGLTRTDADKEIGKPFWRS